MSKISSKDTKPEIMIRKFLYSHGIRFRKNYSQLLGKPDIAITKDKIALFVNGCYWHGHVNCKRASLPKTNTEFWSDKISTNKLRDEKVLRDLTGNGWACIVLWQCMLSPKLSASTLEKLHIQITNLKNRDLHAQPTTSRRINGRSI